MWALVGIDKQTAALILVARRAVKLHSLKASNTIIEAVVLMISESRWHERVENVTIHIPVHLDLRTRVKLTLNCQAEQIAVRAMSLLLGEERSEDFDRRSWFCDLAWIDG